MDKGYIYFINGNDEGTRIKIKDIATGFGIDISSGVSVGLIYYWGDIDYFVHESVVGPSFGGEISSGFILSGSGGIHFSDIDRFGGHAILKTIGASIGVPIPWFLGGQGRRTWTTIIP